MTTDEFRAGLEVIGWKQSDFALATGLSTVAVSNWLTGNAPLPQWAQSHLALLIKLQDLAGDLLMPPTKAAKATGLTPADQGVIRQYVGKIQALAMKACDGANVENAVQDIVKEACGHFSVIAPRKPDAYRAAFRSKLKLIGDNTDSSQPKYKETMEYAATLIDVYPI